MQFQAMMIMGCLFMCLHLVLFFSPPPPLFIYCFVCDGLVTFPRCKIGILDVFVLFFGALKLNMPLLLATMCFFFKKKAKKK